VNIAKLPELSLAESELLKSVSLFPRWQWRHVSKAAGSHPAALLSLAAPGVHPAKVRPFSFEEQGSERSSGLFVAM
jgi:hypothetical protein